ncbi:RNA polymerase III subunit I [Dermacentor variabilis]|uniref:RNA polymerase III subunit I n=1 Tax=Dermacentor variabilis TaxID=34621 RepID=UPI003F5C9B66
MKIIKENSAFLSNFEVLKLLKDLQSDKKASVSGAGKAAARTVPNLATVSYETITYLEETACVRQTDQHIEDFLRQITALPFKLTKIEKLQLINHRPTSPVEIQLLIEESEERLSEEDVATILELVERTLPPIKDEEPEKAVQEGEEGDEESMQCE